MPQKKKSKTTKEMKQSIDGLYNALQKSKFRHGKASKLVKYHRENDKIRVKIMEKMATEINELKYQLAVEQDKKANVSEAMADLIKNIV